MTNSYFDQMVLGASPVELIRLLYRKAIAKTREAREHLQANRIEERSAAITLSYRVIQELMNSLDPASAPELCQRLQSLYCYMQERLLEANLKQTDGPLADVLGVLITLDEAWQSTPDSLTDALAPATVWANTGGEETTRVVLTA